MRAPRTLTAAVTALALVGGTGTTAAHAASIGGFGASPAPKPGQTQPPPYFTLRLAPTHDAVVHVLVTNTSAAPTPVAIEPVTGLTGQTSGSVYGNAVTAIGNELRVDPADADLVLPPHSRRQIAVHVSVAPGAWAGDHLAGLAIVDRDPRTGTGRFRITEIERVVIGISVRVPGVAGRALRIGRLSAEALGNTPEAAVRVPVANVGGLYCRPDLAVRLTGGGRPATTVTRSLDTILPHSSIAYPMPWSHALAAGTYRAAVTATGCGAAQHRSEVLAVVTSRPAARPGPLPAPAAAPAHSHSSLVGWPLLALVGVGGLVLGGLATRRRRTPPATPPAESAA